MVSIEVIAGAVTVWVINARDAGSVVDFWTVCVLAGRMLVITEVTVALFTMVVDIVVVSLIMEPASVGGVLVAVT